MDRQPAARRLGEYIRMRRREVGMTNAEDLANRLGWRLSRVQYLETKQANIPEPDELDAIADILDCTRDDLLRAAGYLNAETSQNGYAQHGAQHVRTVQAH